MSRQDTDWNASGFLGRKDDELHKIILRLQLTSKFGLRFISRVRSVFHYSDNVVGFSGRPHFGQEVNHAQ